MAKPSEKTCDARRESEPDLRKRGLLPELRYESGLKSVARWHRLAWTKETMTDTDPAGQTADIAGKPLSPPSAKPKRKKRLGLLEGLYSLPDSFFDPLPQEELDAWNGGSSD